MRPLLLTVGVLVALGTAAGGVWAIQQDLAPLGLGTTTFERIEAAAIPAGLSGVSYQTQQQALFDCANVLINVRTESAGGPLTERHKNLVNRCVAIADHATSALPTSSHAWYVGALAASILQDWDGMNRRLVQSFNTGRAEQWITSLRVSLSERHRDHLDEKALLANERDLGLLAASASGVVLIAYRYVNEPDFRERITAIVEKLPQDDQQRFLNRVRQITNSRN